MNLLTTYQSIVLFLDETKDRTERARALAEKLKTVNGLYAEADAHKDPQARRNARQELAAALRKINESRRPARPAKPAAVAPRQLPADKPVAPAPETPAASKPAKAPKAKPAAAPPPPDTSA